MIPLDLDGRTVVVTGAAGGIGSVLVRRFAEAGAVVVAQHRPGRAGPLPALAHELGSVLLEPAELTRAEDVERLFSSEGARRGVDVLVNNAGAFPVLPLLDTRTEDLEDVVRANLVTTHACLRRAALGMRETGGAIVNIASLNAGRPMPDQAAYNSAKAAVVALTRSAALELGPYGIRVNAVSPGLVDRPGLEHDWPEGVGRWRGRSPLGRLGRPADVADACVFLGSDLARWITGQELVVDGGTSVAAPY